MRLIDADKLSEIIKHTYLDGDNPSASLSMSEGDTLIGKFQVLDIIFDEPTIISREDIEVLKIIKEHFQVYFDDDSDNGLDTIQFNGFSLDRLWEDGYDEEFEKVKNWLWKG